MEGTLSKALQKYYTRKGNRIVFSNGMTLNQLALEMWEGLGYEGIDPSVISRVLSGERLFTSSQLDVFGQILEIKWTETQFLKAKALVEIGGRYGLDEKLLERVITKDFSSRTIENNRTLKNTRRQNLFSLIENDKTGEEAISFFSQKLLDFCRGEFKDIPSELEDVEKSIANNGLNKETKGELWLGAANSMRGLTLSHLLSPDFFKKNPGFALRELYRNEPQLHKTNPLRPYTYYSWSVLIRLEGEAIIRDKGPSKEALEAFVDCLRIEQDTIKAFSTDDVLLAGLYAEIMAVTSDLEIYFPSQAASLLRKGESSEDYYNRVLEFVARIGIKARYYEAVTREFKARWNLRKVLKNRKGKMGTRDRMKLLEEAISGVKKSQLLAKEAKGDASLVEINSSVTEVNIYKASGEYPPKEVMFNALKLVSESGDIEQGYRLLSGW